MRPNLPNDVSIIEQLRHQLQHTLEIAHVGTWERNLVSGALWWSEEFRSLFGIPFDELPSLDGFISRLHPDDRDRIRTGIDNACASGDDVDLRYRVLRADVLVCHFQACLRVVTASDGRPLRLCGTMQDITVQNAVEEELRRQTAYLTAILNHLPQGISVFDEHLRLQYWNARLGEVLELPQELLYRNVAFEDLIMVPAMRGEYGPGDPREQVRTRRELALKFKAHRFERTRPNGRTHLIAGEPLYLDGRIAGFITTYTDITERKLAERELEQRNAVLQTVVDNIPCGISHFDADLQLQTSNAEFRRVLDLPEALFAHGAPNLKDLLLYNARRGEYGPGDAVRITEKLLDRARQPQAHSFDRLRPDGTMLQVKGQPLPDGGFVTIYNDITERERAAHRQLLADKVFENSLEAIAILDPSRHILSVNPAFSDITGLSADAVTGTVFNPVEGEATIDTSIDNATLWQMLTTRGTFAGETSGRRANGTCYPRWLTMSTVRDKNTDQPTHFIAIFTDISERKQAEADIQHLAHHDTLTGLANRFSLNVRLDQAINDARRSGQAVAVLFLDLDRFKTINDSLGHHVGDELLVQVGRRLRDGVRESDTVARLGGDEFVVVLQGIGGANDVAHTAAHLFAQLSQPYALESGELHAIPSIGISLFPDDGDSPNGLLRNADAAMYHAKALGRGNFQFYTEELNRAASARFELERSLRLAIGRNELEVWYQPLFTAASGTLAGLEALVRWHHPQHGLIAPDRFIDLAEETGLIVELGKWVLREACTQVAGWANQGADTLRLAVNLSVRQLRDTQLPATVAAILTETGLPAERLEFEITESSIMTRPEEAIGMLRALKALGVAIAIDDFGTGYSSLSYLKLFPLDRLKIDRSFIAELEHDPNDAAIVAAAITLAHNLGLLVVAEGVETAGQAERLIGYGCDELQGYHYGRPQPASLTETLLRGQI
jgi:diguanylate cyclase (GGDEF)-like protein/PAS domain S-box-containing protein